ncbi:hypothetical protein [Catenuloplanes japonicus]|uniref:hypothetical protein n=1 Tax=Catenuloplanes japonicus TaxID=33876 RepID=UPI00068D3D4D|nr:hypothetical protein [Catenuloplanes japonicus]
MHTYRTALALAGVSVPEHLAADTEVPILTGPQAQGDLLVLPGTPPSDARWEPVGDEGVQVVHGEATGNTHWLHRGFDSPGVRWAPATGQTLGFLFVPEGQSAQLIHTDEHGANGVGGGTYLINRKREALPTFVSRAERDARDARDRWAARVSWVSD